MTVGEKIKEARKQCGLSQEALAEKMNVSRSAIAKWETNKGIPDIENLKVLSQMLCVSIDYLLDNGGTMDVSVMRESIDLEAHGKGSRKARKDRIMLSRFPNAEIYTLLGKMKLTKGEKVVDNAIGFLTDAPFGIPDFINGIKHFDKEFYLVCQDQKQFFVTVTDEFMEIRQLATPMTDRKFEIDDWMYTNCGKIKVKK
ncbi:MAG: helix-turn-helix domain-containing protein [Ruminococcus sp.]